MTRIRRTSPLNGDRSGVVLLVRSGQRRYREYLLEGAARSRPLWLIDDVAPTWQQPYLAGSTTIPPLEGTGLDLDLPRLLEAADDVARSHGVSGVLTYDEPSVLAAARVAASLGVPGLGLAGARGCRDKHTSRTVLTGAGLPQPRFALASTAARAAAVGVEIGYPVVVKPRGMAGSVGVTRASGPAELLEAFRRAERASRMGPAGYAGGVLVEELVDGSEISVDGAVVDGEYFPFCVAHKLLGEPPYFEEVGHIVDGADPLLTDAGLRDLLGHAHAALGVGYAVTHTEIRFTSRGPVVIEVNGRLGGDLIPYLGQLATGVDPGAVAVDVAEGIRPRIEPDHRTCVGIRFCYPPEDCRVVGITVPEPESAAGLLEAHAMAAPGDAVRLPPRAHMSRHAFVICTGDEPSVCGSRLSAAAERVRLRYETLDEPEYTGRPW
jgi:hypothetical protein